MGIERGKVFPIGEKQANERFMRTKDFIEEAFANGHFVHLPQGQREALITLYSLGDSDTRTTPLTFTKYGGELEVRVSRQAIQDRHRRALRRLERIKNGQPPVEESGRSKLEIDIREAMILFGAGYTRKEVAAEFDCSETTLDLRKREYGIVLKKGRPRKSRNGSRLPIDSK